MQVVHPRPQTQQGESVVKPETPLLIILSIACKCEVHGDLFSPLFEGNTLSIPQVSVPIHLPVVHSVEYPSMVDPQWDIWY